MSIDPSDNDTKSRILAAAFAEFTAKGIAGARVDAIAARAGANKQMLYYYFGSKEELFREILRRRLVMSAEQLRAVEWADPDHLDVFYEHQAAEHVRLLMWEALEYEEGTPLEEEELRRGLHHDWLAAIRQQQETGHVRGDLDPSHVLLTQLALVLFPLAFPQLTRLATGLSPTDPDFIAARSRFLRDVAPRLLGVDVPEHAEESDDPAFLAKRQAQRVGLEPKSLSRSRRQRSNSRST
jgi:AcrR family transcriptional regulator